MEPTLGKAPFFMKGIQMKTYALEFVLFGWLAYNIAIEIVSWFDEEELQAPPAIESTPAYDILESGTDFPIEQNVAG